MAVGRRLGCTGSQAQPRRDLEPRLRNDQHAGGGCNAAARRGLPAVAAARRLGAAGRRLGATAQSAGAAPLQASHRDMGRVGVRLEGKGCCPAGRAASCTTGRAAAVALPLPHQRPCIVHGSSMCTACPSAHQSCLGAGSGSESSGSSGSSRRRQMRQRESSPRSRRRSSWQRQRWRKRWRRCAWRIPSWPMLPA